MSKKYRMVTEFTDLVEPLCGHLDDIRAEVNDLIETYGKDAFLTTCSTGHDNIDTNIEWEREETDKERDKRLALAKKIRKKKAETKLQIKDKELKEYKRLHDKYGRKKL